MPYMLTYAQYLYMDSALRFRRTMKPRVAPYPLNDGHIPVHRQCQVTAMHLEVSYGWGAQIGIQWLDKDGHLVPWPHVVNWVDDILTDYSCPILESKLGFTLIGNDVDEANGLTASLDQTGIYGPQRVPLDPFLTRLHDDWFAKLQQFSQSNEMQFAPAL